MPAVVGLLGAGVFVAGFNDVSLWRLIEYSGFVSYAILLMTCLSVLALTRALWLAGRGVHVPAALSLLLAGLPWVVGVAGAQFETNAIMSSLRNYEESGAPLLLLAVGISEASAGRALGAWCTSALAAALALGLGVAALGQHPARSKATPGALGVALVLPMIALAGYAVFSGVFGSHVLYGVVAAIGVIAALLLASAAIGSSCNAHTAALASAVAPAGLVSFLGAIAAMETGAFCGTARAVEWIGPSRRTALLLERAATFVIGGRLASAATIALGLAVLLLVIRAFAHHRPTRGQIASGIAVGLVIASVVGTDIIAKRTTARDVSEFATAPWRGMSGFTPVTVSSSGDGWRRPPVAIVTVNTILPLGGPPIPLSAVDQPGGPSALAEALHSAQSRTHVESRHVPDWRLPDATPVHVDNSGRRSMFGRNGIPAMELAIDARVPAGVLRKVIIAARIAGGRALVLGGSGSGVAPEAVASLERNAPLVALLARRVVTITLLLEETVPAGHADTDPLLWHATVTARSTGHFTTRAAAGREPMVVPTKIGLPWYRHVYEGRDEEPRAPAYLALNDDATAGSLTAFAEAAMQHGLQPVVVTGALPGQPDQPFPPR